MESLKFFDIHTHVFPEKLAPAACRNLGAFYEFTVAGNGTAGQLAQKCIENGVLGALVLLTVTNPKHVRAVNSGGIELVRQINEAGVEAYAFACWHQDAEDPESEVEFAIENGMAGFKIHPDIQGCSIDDKRFFDLYRLCESNHLAVYFHMGDNRPQYRFSEAKKLLNVIERYPGLKIGAAHLGGYNAWQESHLLAGLQNVWFDTSSSLFVTGPERAAELIHMLGTDRCMFGTDYPVTTADAEIPRFMAMKLSESELKAVTWDNARKFLGIPPLPITHS